MARMDLFKIQKKEEALDPLPYARVSIVVGLRCIGPAFSFRKNSEFWRRLLDSQSGDLSTKRDWMLSFRQLVKNLFLARIVLFQASCSL